MPKSWKHPGTPFRSSSWKCLGFKVVWNA